MDDERLIDIESRIAFFEDAQQQLSGVIARQEKELEHLTRRVQDLEAHLRQVLPSLVGDIDKEPPPPHY
jgi:SlyX protein